MRDERGRQALHESTQTQESRESDSREKIQLTEMFTIPHYCIDKIRQCIQYVAF